jgi:phosphopantothenoylcysteine decarboxylase/phosphopantothenate--cysteine ligase
MHEAVMREAARADVVIMAAAVADYAPIASSAGKVAKADAPLTITLQPTKDILADLGRLPSRAAGVPLLVGFAAETDNVVEKARAKRARKNVDLIVANDVSRTDAGFDVPTNAVTLITADDERDVPLQGKDGVAAAILDRVESLLGVRTSAPVRA